MAPQASKIIASTYEIKEELGAGGGGVVYSGEHLRLGKKVVLKADKRTPATPPEILRREVDTLKNLSHTYIPQVYDFVVEDGIVYTVMDYIEGESLDRPLKRGERFPQSQVIGWAKQLLSALSYLHTRPPHGILHADIKPANIMLTPDGDIRLIDFNIALFLGEEGAVRVGYSLGYASPEHYSSSSDGDTERTELTEENRPHTGRPYASTRRPGGLLDARSDIYSAGATLYHLFSGRRPSKNAGAVRPLTAEDGVSPAVSAIIQKAMLPDPEDRYQTADEMLRAFQRLHPDDPRSRCHKRRVQTVAGALTLLFLAGGLSTFIGLKQMEKAQEREKIAAETSEKALAAVSASEAAYRGGDVPEAIQQALSALELDSDYAPKAQKALTDALEVYDLSDSFQPYRSLPLPSAPLKTALSPEGTWAMALVSGQLRVYRCETGELWTVLDAEASALSDAVFVDENTIIYAGAGALQSYSLTEEKTLWSAAAATTIALSADGSTVAAVYRDENTAAVYDAHTGQALKTVSFQNRHLDVPANDVMGDQGNILFALSGDGTWLAVSFSDGGLRLFNLRSSEEDLELFDASDYNHYYHFEGGFFGQYFAFSASAADESVFAVVDTEAGAQTGGFTNQNIYHVHTDENGILLSYENYLLWLDPVTGEQKEAAYTGADIEAFSWCEGYVLLALADGSTVFFDDLAAQVNTLDVASDFVNLSAGYALLGDRNTPALRLLRLETHPEEQAFAYDRNYLHDEARIAANGNVLLYRYDGFRLYGPDGSLLADADLPDVGQVYDQQFRRAESGDYLEVTYNDGLIRAYSAVDGQLISETPGTPPDGTLDEEFLTDTLRIEAPLHGTPAAYDRETGELIRELEKDDYLAYVTQVGEYVVTEYITAEGERYGLLLDGNCETLARLPGLCDILPDDTLVFDDMRGNLRKSHIWSVQELTAFVNK